MENYEKKYKEALKVMESLYNIVKYQSSSEALLTGQTIEKAFPELKESEDEKNIKNLIDELKRSLTAANCQNDACGGGHEKRIALLEWSISWLEKQGEQKPAWSEESDKRIHTIKVFYPSIGIGVEEAIEKGIVYSKKGGDMLISINGIFLLVTQSSTVEKIMEEYNKCVGNSNDIKEKVNPLVQWTADDESYLKGVICDIECEVLCANCSRNIADMKINWLKSLKERVQPQPKQEWNEKDKANLDNIIWLCENCEKGIENTWIPSQAREIKELIKSLKPNHWKPSEEQMEIIDMILTNESMDDNVSRILRELKEQLKKLQKG